MSSLFAAACRSISESAFLWNILAVRAPSHDAFGKAWDFCHCSCPLSPVNTGRSCPDFCSAQELLAESPGASRPTPDKQRNQALLWNWQHSRDRQPRSISWASHAGATSRSTPPPPLHLINISSHLTQIEGSCHRRTLPCNYSVPVLVNAALNHSAWQLESGASDWLQTSYRETTFSSKSRESASPAVDWNCGLAPYCSVLLCAVWSTTKQVVGLFNVKPTTSCSPFLSKSTQAVKRKAKQSIKCRMDFVFSVIICCEIIIATVISVVLGDVLMELPVNEFQLW